MRIEDTKFIKKVKADYPHLEMDIDNLLLIGDNNNYFEFIDTDGRKYTFDEEQFFSIYNEYIISVTCLCNDDKEMIDFAYAIELYILAKEKKQKSSYEIYGNEVYKPAGYLLLSLIDFSLQKYAIDNLPQTQSWGGRGILDEIFIEILKRNNDANVTLQDDKIMLIMSIFYRLFYMFDNSRGFIKEHNITNRNCIMHNSIQSNNTLVIPEITKEEVINLIPLYINVLILIQKPENGNIKIFYDFLSSLK